MGQDKASVVARLEAYNQRFGAILDLLEVTLPLHGELKEKAQSLLKSLKGDLKTEYQKMSTLKGQEQLSEVERTCYEPVIHETYAGIQTSSNSIPDKEWIDDLYDARINITHMLDQLATVPGS